MNPQPPICADITVRLDNLIYHQEPSLPEDKPHAFIYFISIKNNSSNDISLIGRKWILEHNDNTFAVIEGDGIIAKTPTLRPNEIFSYNSYHITDQDCVAYGSYLALDHEGNAFTVPIPEFKMTIPHAAKQLN